VKSSRPRNNTSPEKISKKKRKSAVRYLKGVEICLHFKTSL